MPKVIGYLEGSDSLWLTRLLVQGHDTMPLSNGYDGHGMSIQQLSPQHKISAVICYMHKLVPPRHLSVTVKEILHATKIYDIPVLIACPKDAFGAAHERLGEVPPNAGLVDPAEMLDKLRTMLA